VVPLYLSNEITNCDITPVDLGLEDFSMPTPFEHYGRTLRGRQLAAIINDPDRYPEYRAFSREGFPAVTALLSLVKPELEALRRSDRREFDAASSSSAGPSVR
jgi:hypothetical protein